MVLLMNKSAKQKAATPIPNVHSIFDAHPLTKMVMEDCIKFGFFKKDRPTEREYSEAEYYALWAFKSLISIRECFREAELSIRVLNNYPGQSSGVTSFQYFYFTVQNFYIRIGSLDDRALWAVNNVFHLGNKKITAREAIINNVHVQRTPVPSHFKLIEKAIQLAKTHRNEVLHRGNFQLEGAVRAELMYILTDEMIERFEAPAMRRNFKYFRSKELADLYVEIKKRLCRELESASAPFPEFVQSLTQTYTRMRARLS